MVLVAAVIASSLMAITDQARKPAQAAAGDPGAAAMAGGSNGCGGGCGEGEQGACAGGKAMAAMKGGPGAAPEAKMGASCPMMGKQTAKSAAAATCPHQAKGEKCDPKTCDDCAKGAAAKSDAKHPAGCPMSKPEAG